MKRPELPQVFAAGTAKAAMFQYWLMVCPPAGMMDTPGTRFGRWLAATPSSICAAERVTTMLTGMPVRAIALSAQVPAADQPAGQPAVQEAAPGAERQLIDGAGHEIMANVIGAEAAVAGAAGHVLHRDAFARADRARP